MPFLGLTNNAVEISGVGYHRLDLSDVNFGMSPGFTRSDRITFINKLSITFGPAPKDWGLVDGTAVYDEIDSPNCICNVKFKGGRHLRVMTGECVTLPPGLFNLQTSVRDASLVNDDDDSPFTERPEISVLVWEESCKVLVQLTHKAKALFLDFDEARDLATQLRKAARKVERLVAEGKLTKADTQSS